MAPVNYQMKDGVVPVMTDNGPVLVSESDAKRMFDDAAAVPMSFVEHDEIKAKEAQEAKYGDSPGTAAALGFARGGTFGGSDWAIRKLVGSDSMMEMALKGSDMFYGTDLAKHLPTVLSTPSMEREAEAGKMIRGLAAENQLATLSGEAVSLAAGPVGMLGKAAGKAAGRGVGALVTGEGRLARAANTVLPNAAQFGVEGGLMGAQQKVSMGAMSDSGEITDVAQGVASGALMGLGLSAGLGVLSGAWAGLKGVTGYASLRKAAALDQKAAGLHQKAASETATLAKREKVLLDAQMQNAKAVEAVSAQKNAITDARATNIQARMDAEAGAVKLDQMQQQMKVGQDLSDQMQAYRANTGASAAEARAHVAKPFAGEVRPVPVQEVGGQAAADFSAVQSGLKNPISGIGDIAPKLEASASVRPTTVRVGGQDVTAVFRMGEGKTVKRVAKLIDEADDPLLNIVIEGEVSLSQRIKNSVAQGVDEGSMNTLLGDIRKVRAIAAEDWIKKNIPDLATAGASAESKKTINELVIAMQRRGASAVDVAAVKRVVAGVREASSRMAEVAEGKVKAAYDKFRQGLQGTKKEAEALASIHKLRSDRVASSIEAGAKDAVLDTGPVSMAEVRATLKPNLGQKERIALGRRRGVVDALPDELGKQSGAELLAKMKKGHSARRAPLEAQLTEASLPATPQMLAKQAIEALEVTKNQIGKLRETAATGAAAATKADLKAATAELSRVQASMKQVGKSAENSELAIQEIAKKMKEVETVFEKAKAGINDRAAAVNEKLGKKASAQHAKAVKAAEKEANDLAQREISARLSRGDVARTQYNRLKQDATIAQKTVDAKTLKALNAEKQRLKEATRMEQGAFGKFKRESQGEIDRLTEQARMLDVEVSQAAQNFMRIPASAASHFAGYLAGGQIASVVPGVGNVFGYFMGRNMARSVVDKFAPHRAAAGHRIIESLQSGTAGKMARGAQVASMRAKQLAVPTLNRGEYEESVNQIKEMDIKRAGETLQRAMAGDPNIEIVADHGRKLATFLKKVASESPVPGTMVDRRRFSLQVTAAMDPSSPFKTLLYNRIDTLQVAALEAVYPVMLEFARMDSLKLVTDAREAGHKFSNAEEKAFAIFMGMPYEKDVRLMNALQGASAMTMGAPPNREMSPGQRQNPPNVSVSGGLSGPSSDTERMIG